MHAEGLHRYRVADRTMASTLPLPELNAASDAVPDWTFAFRVGGYRVTDATPFHFWREPDGTRLLEFARAREGLVLRFPGTARFVLHPDGTKIDGYPSNRLPFAAIRPALINVVLPLLFSRDRLVLHASAVTTPHGAIAFVGTRRAGKSTLAAALARAGCAHLTDDVLSIRQEGDLLAAVPSQFAVRMWIDSARQFAGHAARGFPRIGRHTEKRWVRPDALGMTTADTPVPLRRLYFLSRAPFREHSMRSISPRDAAIALMRHSFQLETDRVEVLRRVLEQVTALMAQTTQRRLRIAFDYRRLDALVDLVVDDLKT